MRSWIHGSGLVLGLLARPASPPDLTIVTDEADAALAILESQAAGKPVPEAAWARLFETDGYRRLKAREASMGRAFEDSSFRHFLTSDTLLRRTASLRRTLRDWSEADFAAASRRALAYLPAGVATGAKVYLLIKPKTNSFVFDVGTDPAVMLYLDPARTREQLENTVAHELHHVGYGTACDSQGDAAADSALYTARLWLGGFAEGIAMLAAAGGPDVHPHTASPAEDRARWDRDLANAATDLRRVEKFLLDVLDRRLTHPDSITRVGMSFFGVQGPWYTLGWLMAATVERAEGRPALIRRMCEPAALIQAYNAAARDRAGSLPLWSEALFARLSPPAGRRS
jgi:hypothetical protein